MSLTGSLVMKKLIGLLVFAMVMFGCAESVNTTNDASTGGDSPQIQTDARSTDSAINETQSDSGVTEDALVPPILVVENTSVPGFVQEGGQDQHFRYMRLTANQAVEIRSKAFIFGPNDATITSYIGSRGTQYFRDLRMTELDTNQTIMGPIEVRPLTINAFNGLFSDPFIMQAGESRTFAFQMDVAMEDEPGELVGQSYHI